MEIEGTGEKLSEFSRQVMAELPPAAEVIGIDFQEVEIRGEDAFFIIESGQEGEKEVIIPPDIATCDDCLSELSDPLNKRYQYPFINCTNCGPRLTIVRDVPYDRPNTSMNCFPMCRDCLSEYTNPEDRRFHAEPNACPICGPKLWLADSMGKELTAYVRDPIAGAVDKIRQGWCVAIKGLGGFHLAVDATSEEAVKRLRDRKCREEKPLAVMVRDLETAAKLAEIGVKEQECLLSPRRPIVLCRKKRGGFLAPSVSPGLPDVGIMLPYTPIHHLLLDRIGKPLVMTSGNKVDEPICIGNREAVVRLSRIADYFLLHNRDILVRCDDSVEACVGESRILIRRSRGWAPKPIILTHSFPDVLALGGHLKSTLCMLKGNRAYLSPHIGDLETPEARDFFMENVRVMERISGCRPAVVACDLHPAYWTTQLAEEISKKVVFRVQHHHAHIVSAMAENDLFEPVIGLAMDGTGYGDDGTVWGGEFLLASTTSYERIGHLNNFALPGTERAVREPWRSAAGLLHATFGKDWPRLFRKLPLAEIAMDTNVINNMIEERFNTPETSSLGRLFDAVAAIVGMRKKVSFEGQAAMELEALVVEGIKERYPYDIMEEGKKKILDFRPFVKALVEDVLRDKDRRSIVSAFHYTLIDALVSMTRMMAEATGIRKVVLSGGCFQNRVLLKGVMESLSLDGLKVYINSAVPINDGGLSLGQAVVAGSIMRKENEHHEEG